MSKSSTAAVIVTVFLSVGLLEWLVEASGPVKKSARRGVARPVAGLVNR